jgi:hypothetical protein
MLILNVDHRQHIKHHNKHYAQTGEREEVTTFNTKYVLA